MKTLSEIFQIFQAICKHKKAAKNTQANLWEKIASWWLALMLRLGPSTYSPSIHSPQSSSRPLSFYADSSNIFWELSLTVSAWMLQGRGSSRADSGKDRCHRTCGWNARVFEIIVFKLDKKVQILMEYPVCRHMVFWVSNLSSRGEWTSPKESYASPSQTCCSQNI